MDNSDGSKPPKPATGSLSWPINQGLHPKHRGPFITNSTVVNVNHVFSGISAYRYIAILAPNACLAEYGIINPAMPAHK